VSEIPSEVEETVGAWVGIVAVFTVIGQNEMIKAGRITAETRQEAAEVLSRLAKLRLDGFPSDDLKHAASLHAPDIVKKCCHTLNDAQIKILKKTAH
jgi:hypothetical protein